jgi:hypothetical protein
MIRAVFAKRITCNEDQLDDRDISDCLNGENFAQDNVYEQTPTSLANVLIFS